MAASVTTMLLRRCLSLRPSSAVVPCVTHNVRRMLSCSPGHGPVCVVMGAGVGLGGAVAREFAVNHGMTVVACRRKVTPELEQLQRDIAEAGGVCHGWAVDARDQSQVATLFQRAEQLGPVDVVVFNVGANVRFGLLDTTTRVYTKERRACLLVGALSDRSPQLLKLY
eukprot:m.181979 g.181979  ORF g.181979 m.181979 type:complete len:168 (-) comp18050_c0_seq2:530-1033(-)